MGSGRVEVFAAPHARQNILSVMNAPVIIGVREIYDIAVLIYRPALVVL